MELFLAAWSCCFKLYKQMSSFLSIHFKSRNVIQFIVQLLGLYLGFLFLSFLGCSGTSPGGNSATFGTIIWLFILALHLDHLSAKLTATCIFPRNNPKTNSNKPMCN